MLGFGPITAKISLVFQHLPCFVEFESSFLSAEWPFHPAPLKQNYSRGAQERIHRKGLRFAQSMVEMFLSKHFTLVLMQTLLEMEEEAL